MISAAVTAPSSMRGAGALPGAAALLPLQVGTPVPGGPGPCVEVTAVGLKPRNLATPERAVPYLPGQWRLCSVWDPHSLEFDAGGGQRGRLHLMFGEAEAASRSPELWGQTLCRSGLSWRSILAPLANTSLLLSLKEVM